MTNWRKHQEVSRHQLGQWTRSYSRKPPLAPDRWQATVPAWEKKFCAVIGSVPWSKVVETKKYIYLHDNVMKWDDSAAKEAFDNAKKKFWAEINGLPCDVTLPDPDMYIDNVDWNSTVDPELILDLEREPTPSDKANEVVILDSAHLLDQSFFCKGWGEAEGIVPSGWGEAEAPPPTGWGQAEGIVPTGWGEAEAPSPTGWGQAEGIVPPGWGQAEGIVPTGWGEAEGIAPTGWGQAEIPPTAGRVEGGTLQPPVWGDSGVNVNSQVDNCIGWGDPNLNVNSGNKIPAPPPTGWGDPNPNVNSGGTGLGEPEVNYFPPPQGWNSDLNAYGGVYSTGWGEAETDLPKDADTGKGSWEQYGAPREPAKVSEWANRENDSWQWRERQQSGFQKTGKGRGIGNWGSSGGADKQRENVAFRQQSGFHQTSAHHGNENQIGGRGRRNNRGRKRGGFAYGRSYGDNMATARWEVKTK